MLLSGRRCIYALIPLLLVTVLGALLQLKSVYHASLLPKQVKSLSFSTLQTDDSQLFYTGDVIHTSKAAISPASTHNKNEGSLSLANSSPEAFKNHPLQTTQISSSTNSSMKPYSNLTVPPKDLASLPLDVIERVEKFVFFIGYPRSGHSIIGSMIDAHPQMVIAHELFLFDDWWSNVQHDGKKLTKSLIFRAIYRSSYTDAYRGWRNGSKDSKGYSLELDYPWQGRYNTSIQVIGDKSGGNTAYVYTKSANRFKTRFDELRKVVGIPLRVIHVVRNPFDIISTTALYEAGKKKFPAYGRGAKIVSNFVHDVKSQVAEMKNKTSDVNKIDKVRFHDDAQLQTSIGTFFKMANAVREVIKLTGESNILEVHNYELVKDPAATMLKVCTFLGVHCSESYLEACVHKTFRKLSLSREYILWSETLKEKVEKESQNYAFFRRYSFNSDI